MLLAHLATAGEELVAAGEAWPSGFGPHAVQWVVPLDAAGKWEGPPVPLGPDGKVWIVPTVGRSSNVKPALLCDTLEYAMGVSRDEKTAGRHGAFRALVEACAAETGSRDVAAVAAFLAAGRAAEWGTRCTAPYLPQQFVAFRVEGRFPAEEGGVRAYWSARAAEEDEGAGSAGGDAPYCCHVCGAPCVPLRLWPGPRVNGIAGARRASLTSFDDPSAWSRGAAQGFNAPTCRRCAERAQLALYRFVDADPDHRHHRIEGRLTFLFWSRSAEAGELLARFFNPQPEAVRLLVKGVQAGRRVAAPDASALYLAVLEGRIARIALRQWVETSLDDVAANVRSWFRDQQLPWGPPLHPLGVRALVRALCRDEQETTKMLERVPEWAESLTLAALQARPLPERLLSAAVCRVRRAREVGDAAAVLIQLCLRRRPGAAGRDADREGMGVTPDMTAEDEQAFRLGRLLAVLDALQRSAGGGSVSSRFYGSASTMPQVVFPRLLDQARPRLARLARERPGEARRFEASLDEVIGGLASAFPPILTLRQQGWFALGFHRQRAGDREPGAVAAQEVPDEVAP